jgi:hypothetical protein
MTLDSADAAELAEMLPFPGHWLASDPGRLGASLNAFAGNPAYGIQQLRDDIDASSSCPAAATAKSSSAVTTTNPVKEADDNRRTTSANPGPTVAPPLDKHTKRRSIWARRHSCRQAGGLAP